MVCRLVSLRIGLGAGLICHKARNTSIIVHSPVIKWDSFDARYETSPAISSGVPLYPKAQREVCYIQACVILRPLTCFNVLTVSSRVSPERPNAVPSDLTEAQM